MKDLLRGIKFCGKTHFLYLHQKKSSICDSLSSINYVSAVICMVRFSEEDWRDKFQFS